MKHPFRMFAAATLAVAALTLVGCGSQETPTDFVDIDTQAAEPTPTFQAFPDEAVTPDPISTSTLDVPPDAEVTPTPNANATPTPTPRYSAEDLNGEDEATPAPKRTYDEYRAMNSDVVGWIDVPGTNVQYPILHGSDNDYYLTHSVEKTASKSGAVFLDAASKVNAKYSVIFGHNMKNGTMFHGLYEYTNSDFYKNHREFKITWGDRTYTYKVFAVYSVDLKAASYFYRDSHFKSDAQFAYTVNELAKNSKYDVDTTIQEGDKVVTLSTCNRTDYSNGRFVIQAVQVG